MSWWKHAKVGDNVVCIKKGPWLSAKTMAIYTRQDSTPKFGDILTIKDACIHAQMKSGISLWFGGYNGEGSRNVYCASQFRPVETKSTEKGMAILRSILDGARVPEKESAL